MGRNVFMRSTVRDLWRTLFLLLLIGSISFAFIARAVEYVIVQRETERLGSYYNSIGTLRTAAPFDPSASDPAAFSITAGADLIADSPYIAFGDRRRTFSGAMTGVYNTAFAGTVMSSDGKSYNPWQNSGGSSSFFSTVIMTGELISCEYDGQIQGYYVRLEADKIEAGYPEYCFEGKTQGLIYYSKYGDAEAREIFANFEPGKRYLVRCSAQPGLANVRKYSDIIIQPLIYDGIFCLELAPGEQVDYTLPELAGLREEVEYLGNNQRAMTVITSSDMSAMPNMQPSAKMYELIEGRWLTAEDNTDGNRVCVVNSLFAATRGLAVGDKVELTLRSLYNPYNYGFISEEYDPDWRGYETHTETYEIAGVYKRLPLATGPSYTIMTYSGGSLVTSTVPILSSIEDYYIYVPDSTIPASLSDDGRNTLISGAYSFTLTSSRVQDAFSNEYKEALGEMGIVLAFVESNAVTYWASALAVQNSSLTNAAVFALLQAVALMLVVFIYLRGRRRDFAISRALGVPKGRAVRAMLAPVTLIGIIGIAVGGGASWNYALNKSAQTIASVVGEEGAEFTATLEPTWLIAMCAAVMLLMLLLAAAGSFLAVRRPVLEMLSGRVVRQKRQKHQKRKKTAVADSSSAPLVFTAPLTKGSAPVGNGRRFAAHRRFVMRHIRRSVIRTSLAGLVALAFVVALGQMNRTMDYYETEIDRLYDNTIVTAEVMKVNDYDKWTYENEDSTQSVISASILNDLAETDFVSRVYLVGDAQRNATAPAAAMLDERGSSWNTSLFHYGYSVCGFNDLEFFLNGPGTGFQLDFAVGYDASLFADEWSMARESERIPAILPASLADAMNLAAGDTFYMSNVAFHRMTLFNHYVVAGTYEIAGDSIMSSNFVLVAASAMQMMEGQIGKSAFYSTMSFDLNPSMNRELDSFREVMQKAITGTGRAALQYYLWDNELRQVIEPMEKNLQLMSVLYPVTLGVSVLIAIGLAVLLLMQSAGDAALLRVFGSGKGEVRVMLCAGLVLPCVVGLIPGLFIPSFDTRSLICAALYFAGTLLGAIIGAAGVTRRMPLELLQVRE